MRARERFVTLFVVAYYLEKKKHFCTFSQRKPISTRQNTTKHTILFKNSIHRHTPAVELQDLRVCGAFPRAVKREALPLLWETWRKAGSAELSLTAVQICVYLCIYETLVQ